MTDHKFFFQSKHGFYTQSDHAFRRRAKRLFVCGEGGAPNSEELTGPSTVVGLGTFSHGPFGNPTAFSINLLNDEVYMGTAEYPVVFGSQTRSEHAIVYDKDLDTWSAVKFGLATNIFGTPPSAGAGGVYTMVNYNGVLRMGGVFFGDWKAATGSGPLDVNITPGLIGWSGSAWVPMNTSAKSISAPRRMIVHNGQLWIGGTRQATGGTGNASPVFQWLGNSSFVDVGGATDLGSTGPTIHKVNDMVEFEGDVVVCGTINKGFIKGVARWNGSWSSMGSLDLDESYTLAVFRDELYISGPQTASGTSAKLLKWDGSTWIAAQSLGVDITNSFIDLEVHDDLLYGVKDSGPVGTTVTVYDGEELVGTPFTVGFDPAKTKPDSGRVLSV